MIYERAIKMSSVEDVGTRRPSHKSRFLVAMSSVKARLRKRIEAIVGDGMLTRLRRIKGAFCVRFDSPSRSADALPGSRVLIIQVIPVVVRCREISRELWSCPSSLLGCEACSSGREAD